MAETKHERHGRLSREWVMMAGKETSTYSELLVVIESTMLASMLLMVRQHGMKPEHASIQLEAALQAATERFAEANKG